jgi:hypothetical protein
MGKGNNNLATLRGFRNRILLKTMIGNKYTHMYYENSEELSDILGYDEELLQRTNILIIRLMPAIIGILARGNTSVSEELVQESIDLIETFKAQASPALDKDLSLLKKDIQNGTIFKTFKIKVQKN